MEFFKVVSVEEAQRLIQDAWCLPKAKEVVGLMEACGRYCGEDIRSEVNVPPSDRAVMDGFAVRAEDTFGASEGSPAVLTIAGEVAVDAVPTGEVRSGEAFAVATGSTFPAGADAVVMVEETESRGGQVLVKKPACPGQNILTKGQDTAAGTVVVSEGEYLRPQEVGLLASTGVIQVPVFKPVRVGVISTGSELLPPGEVLSPGKIWDINTYSLSTMVRKDAGAPTTYGIIPDASSLLREVLQAAVKENDIVLVSGGSSVGEKDLTLGIVSEFGEVLFHGIAMKPGKPTLAAADGDTLIVGLPGHPVSVLVAYHLLVRPLVRRQPYRDFEELAFARAELTQRIPSPGGRENYVRVSLEAGTDGVKAVPLPSQSGMISNLHAAAGLVRIPAHKEALEAGESVAVQLL